MEKPACHGATHSGTGSVLPDPRYGVAGRLGRLLVAAGSGRALSVL
jgi:hypothetical protein